MKTDTLKRFEVFNELREESEVASLFIFPQ